MNKLNLRVSYADTDQMGMVHYANYLNFFEIGRTELFREIGVNYKDLERFEIYLPVSSVECKYISPVKYDDLITIETKIYEIAAASITFYYEIKIDDKLLALGKTKHPFVNKNLKPIRIPQNIKQELDEHLGK